MGIQAIKNKEMEANKCRLLLPVQKNHSNSNYILQVSPHLLVFHDFTYSNLEM